jgi:hypothetical protein
MRNLNLLIFKVILLRTWQINLLSGKKQDDPLPHYVLRKMGAA